MGQPGADGSSGQPKLAVINVGYASISGTINPNTTINTDTFAPEQPTVTIQCIKGSYIKLRLSDKVDKYDKKTTKRDKVSL